MFTKTITAKQLLNPGLACEVALGDEISYLERNQVRTATVIACYENAKKFEVNN